MTVTSRVVQNNMPAPRPTRSGTRTPITYAGDSDSESSDPEDTPKPKKTQRPAKKKRLSDFVVADNGSVAAGDDAHTPFKPVNINDDAAEKRRRRKSTKRVRPSLEDVDATMRSSDGTDGGGTPRPGARARANQLNAVEDAPIIKVPLDVMSSNFEEWMKMATDNVSDPTLLIRHMNLP